MTLKKKNGRDLHEYHELLPIGQRGEALGGSIASVPAEKSPRTALGGGNSLLSCFSQAAGP